tara:strand:+ start:176 stop:1996 length:1821 start_codon:yes stop_codon:yes gene_type:complete
MIAFQAKNLSEQFKLAITKHQKNCLKEALEIYENILEINPDHFGSIFHLAILMAQTKKFDKALLYFKKSLKLEPNNPDIHNNLGLVNRDLGNLSESIELFKKAISLKNDFFVAYNNLGVTFRDKGKYKEAKINFLKSIDLNSNYIDPYNNLGLIYAKENKFEEAEKYFLKANNLDPKNLGPINNLGNLFKNKGDISKAVYYFNKVIEINYKNFDAYNNLLDLYEKTNKNNELIKIINKCKNYFPENSVVKLFYGQYLHKEERFHESINCLNETKFNNNELKREKFRSLILAKNYDKIGNFDKAFKFFEITNKINLKLKNININKNNFLNLINERLDFFKSYNKFNYNDYYSTDKSPLFLIGFPRSGTTLLDTILRSHNSVQVLEEKPTVQKLISSIKNQTNGQLNNLNSLNKSQKDILREEYWDNLKSYTDEKKDTSIILDKMPLNIIYVGEIIKIFPNAKFILSLRHPYDSVLSCFMQSFELNNAMANFLSLKDSAILYDSVMSLWKVYEEKMDFDYHIIKYENIVNDFDNTINKTLKFIKLEWSDDLKKFYETAKQRNLINTPSYNQVNKPLYNTSINRWKKYHNKINNIYPILDKWVKEFNYK